jgi:nitrous oxide reductase accessory protein NosL
MMMMHQRIWIAGCSLAKKHNRHLPEQFWETVHNRFKSSLQNISEKAIKKAQEIYTKADVGILFCVTTQKLTNGDGYE